MYYYHRDQAPRRTPRSRRRYFLDGYMYQTKRISGFRYPSQKAMPKGGPPHSVQKYSGQKEERAKVVSLLSSIVHTAVVTSKPLRDRDTPLVARIICVVLGIGAVQVALAFINMLAQLTGPFMSLVYTISGIAASIVALHEFERSRKNDDGPQPVLKSTEKQPAVNRTAKPVEPMTCFCQKCGSYASLLINDVV